MEEANQLLESLNVDSSTSAAFDIINKPLFLPRMLDLSFIGESFKNAAVNFFETVEC